MSFIRHRRATSPNKFECRNYDSKKNFFDTSAVEAVSETHFEWYLHLGPGTDAQAGLLVEGKKGNCMPSVNGIREFLNPGEAKTDVGASQILGSLPTEQLHRRPSRTPARNLARPSALRAGCPPSITNPPAQKWAVF